MSLWNWLFDPSGLTPHGFCLTWEPGLIALHAGADVLVGFSYLSIPLAISSFARQRPDIQYNWMAYRFVGFILACGATHLFSVLTLWVPAYGIEGLVKAVTAALSISTAIMLWPLIPRLVALPSPTQLVRLNEELSSSVAEHERTALSLRESEARGRAANLDLERRVVERTADLQAANRRLENVVEERTAALEQRDLLLREVYHRVKNNLQIVDSLLAMQARKLEQQEGKDALRALRGRIHALGLVHHQLMGSKDLKTFDIAPFLAELSRNILDSGATAGIRLNVEACRLDVGLDFAIPLGLVVTELVTNSLKHAFGRDGGTISVVLRLIRDQTLVLTVADDGCGRPDDDADANAKTGLGSGLVERLVKQLEGTMAVTRVGGTTTQITLALPVAS